MAFCSAVTLCFASIFSLVSAALLAIAFSTDNWKMISVKRAELRQQLETSGREQVLAEFDASPLYFTRTRGLFRECFPGEKTKDNTPNGDLVTLYMSPVETWCYNINYFIPDEEGHTKDFNMEMMARIHMGRAMIALFISAFFFMFVSFITGVVGCWRTSPSNINGSAVLMLIAFLFSAGGMGLFHGVDHYEKMKITEKSLIEPFVGSWDPFLIELTDIRFDWSYIVAWVGVGMCLGSCILFFMAAMCIRSDKQREEAMNMQYLMPVYPQKGQPYGPYGYAAYPGPYYGSQYGLPYSQY